MRPTSRELLVFLNGVTLQVAPIFTRRLILFRSNLTRKDAHCFAITPLFLFNNCSVHFHVFFRPLMSLPLVLHPKLLLRPSASSAFAFHSRANILCLQASARRRVIADKPPISPDAAQLPPSESSKR
jgi:hypothetical protein